MSQPDPVKPLFGPRPDSLLGDKRAFCQVLVTKLRKIADDPTLLEGDDPEAVIGRLSKSQVLNMASAHMMGLDDIVPVELSRQEAEQVLKTAVEKGVAVVGVDGELPPDDVIARTLIQVAALNAVCAPVQAWSPEKQAFMAASKVAFAKFITS